jgi:hypothetical protein
MPDANQSRPDEMRDRAATHELLYEALLRWNIDQEIGSSSALATWVEEYLSEKMGGG